ncbi:MAG: GGDEF domain-containing protein, partial [Smithella sp.]
WFFIGLSLYAVCCSFSIIGFLLGIIPVPLYVLVGSQIGILAYNILIYVIIRTGFNKRFRDPIMIIIQIVAASLWIMEASYYTESYRSATILLYLVAFFFGLFRLNAREFIFLSFFAIAGYAMVILLLYKNHPESINGKIEILNIVILATILPWFSVVGGYITGQQNKLAKSHSIIKENEQRYLELSIIDDLTQLYNSRHFHAQLEKEIERFNRYEQPLTLLMLDLDKFKEFNDTYGHVEGNHVLSRFGEVIKRCLRNPDFAYRYGGEEFTIMLPMTTSEEGIITAKRIQAEFKKEAFTPMPGKEVFVTMSIGLAQYKPKEDLRAFVDRVDRLMYQAKKDGRNRIYSEPEPQENKEVRSVILNSSM